MSDEDPWPSWGWEVTPWAAGRRRTCEANPSIHSARGHKLEKGSGFWIPREEQGRQMGRDGPSRPRGPLPVLGEAQPTSVSRPVSWAAGAAQVLPHPCLKALEARPEVCSPGLACISRSGDTQLAFLLDGAEEESTISPVPSSSWLRLLQWARWG